MIYVSNKIAKCTYILRIILKFYYYSLQHYLNTLKLIYFKMSDEKQPLLCQKIVYYNGFRSTTYQDKR